MTGDRETGRPADVAGRPLFCPPTTIQMLALDCYHARASMSVPRRGNAMDGFTPNTPADCPECGGAGTVEVLGDYLPGSDRTPYDDATEDPCSACDADPRGRAHGWHVYSDYQTVRALAPFVVNVDGARKALLSGRRFAEAKAAGLADGTKPNPRTGRRHVSERVRVALATMEARAQFLEDADAAEYEREITSIRHCITVFRDALGVSE